MMVSFEKMYTKFVHSFFLMEISEFVANSITLLDKRTAIN